MNDSPYDAPFPGRHASPHRTKRFAGRRRYLRVSVFGLVVLLSAIFIWGYTRYATESHWRAEVERLGGRTTVTARETDSSLGRIPILGAFFAEREQLVLILDNPQTIDAILQKATELPPVYEVWVDLNVFNHTITERITESLPGVNFAVYRLPGNARLPRDAQEFSPAGHAEGAAAN